MPHPFLLFLLVSLSAMARAPAPAPASPLPECGKGWSTEGTCGNNNKFYRGKEAVERRCGGFGVGDPVCQKAKTKPAINVGNSTSTTVEQKAPPILWLKAMD